MTLSPITSAMTGIVTDSGADHVKNPDLTHASQTQGIQTTLSSDAASLKALATKAMQAPKTSHEKVEALKMAVSKGSYGVDLGEIASALAKHYSA